MGRAKIVVLCEDVCHEVLARRILGKLGFTHHDLRVERARGGKGSAEQFVRQRFPQELSAIRDRSHRMQVAIIVLTDADKLAVDDRVGQLRDACVARGLPAPGPEDSLMFVVPRRNISTWIAYLLQGEADEEQGRDSCDNTDDCRRAAERLWEMCQAKRLGGKAPPSLQEACRQYNALADQLRQMTR